MTALLALGEVLVEIMRSERDQPLDRGGSFVGPFPSGAPAIFACAAARLGADSRLVGRVGRDAFGELCRRRLEDDGVDTRYLTVSEERSTGIAFVAYRGDGSREFLFHLRHSASAEIGPESIDDRVFDGVSWIHLNGSTLSISPEVQAAGLALLAGARSRGITVSFDPNLRPELLASQRPEWLDALLSHSDVILPSGAESEALSGRPDPAAAARHLLERGASAVVHKLGERGSTLYTREGAQHLPGIGVDEIDPTGAGDAFAAAFATRRVEGADLLDSLAFANVVGALATTRFGPMEGLPSRAEAESRAAEAGAGLSGAGR